MARRKYLVLIILSAVWGLPVFAAAGHWGWGFGPCMAGDWGFWGWFHLLGGALIRVLFIVGLFLALRWMIRSARRERGTSEAIAILRERYARGEITKQEFEQMRRDSSG